MAENNVLENKILKKLQQIWDSMVSDPTKALTDSQEIEKDLIEAGFSDYIRISRYYQGWCLIYLSRLKEAIEILTILSEDFSDDDCTEEHINVLNGLAVAYKDLGDTTRAFFYFTLGLKLSRTAGLLNRELTIRSNMGGFYLENKNYAKALNHFLEILKRTDDSDDFMELKSVVMIDIGQCYHSLKKYDKAEYFLQESRKLSKKMNNLVNDADCLHQLCKLKFAQNYIKEAKLYISEALSICKDTDNIRLECELFLMLGDIDKDFTFFEKANKLSKKINHKAVYQSSCLKLAEHFEELKDYRKSLQFFKEHYKTEKELNTLAAEKKFHNLEMEYEIERNRKNAEIFKVQNIELKESLNWMSILNKIARETMSSLELNSIFNRVYNNINILMDAENFHIVFYDKENDVLNVVKAFESNNEIKPFTFSADADKSFSAWAIKNRKEIIINNIENEYKNYITKRAIYGEGPKAKSSITVPILMRDDEIGALAILSYRENAYKEEHVHLLKSLAAFLSIAIDNSRNFEKVIELNKVIISEKEELERANKKITELATSDNLTGLANRRVFYEMLESAMEQSKRRDEILAVLFIDLDNFKPINDNWGHNAGDKVLKEIADRLTSSIRAADSVARIGGDEFLILLNPVKNRSESGKVAKKIISKIGEPIIIGKATISVGASIGISIYPEQETTADQLIINADSAMYKIKKGNKNGIGFFEKTQ